MSIILDYYQITKKNIVSESKIFGMYELEYEDLEYADSLPMEPDYFQKLYEDVDKWDEVYFRPYVNDFLFYLLAVNFEIYVGFKEIDGKGLIVAFDPKVVLKFLNIAIKHTEYGRQGIFDLFNRLVEDADRKGLLVFGIYG